MLSARNGSTKEQPTNDTLPGRIVRWPIMRNIRGIGVDKEERSQDAVQLARPFHNSPVIETADCGVIGAIKIRPAAMAVADKGHWKRRVERLANVIDSSVTARTQFTSKMRAVDYGDRMGTYDDREQELLDQLAAKHGDIDTAYRKARTGEIDREDLGLLVDADLADERQGVIDLYDVTTLKRNYYVTVKIEPADVVTEDNVEAGGGMANVPILGRLWKHKELRDLRQEGDHTQVMVERLENKLETLESDLRTIEDISTRILSSTELSQVFADHYQAANAYANADFGDVVRLSPKPTSSEGTAMYGVDHDHLRDLPNGPLGDSNGAVGPETPDERSRMAGQNSDADGNRHTIPSRGNQEDGTNDSDDGVVQTAKHKASSFADRVAKINDNPVADVILTKEQLVDHYQTVVGPKDGIYRGNANWITIDNAVYSKTLSIREWPAVPKMGILEPILREHEPGVAVNVATHINPIDQQRAEIELSDTEDQLKDKKEKAEDSRLPMFLQTYRKQHDEAREMVEANQDSEYDLFETNTHIELRSDDPEALGRTIDHINSMMNDEGAEARQETAHHFEGWQSVAPACDDKLEEPIMMFADGVAREFPWTSRNLHEPNGVEFGINMHTNEPLYLDLWNRKTGFDFGIFTKKGGGKTTTATEILGRLNTVYRDDLMTIIIVPLQEYANLATVHDGERLVVGGDTGINPFHIEETPEEKLATIGKGAPYKHWLEGCMDFVEMYYALLEEENRQQYADLIGDSIDDDDIMFLEGFTRRIAEELSDDELDPLLGRLKDWVENPITRKIIAMRGAEVTLGQIVNEQKILIVNNDLPKEAKIMTANAVVSGIWTAVTSRKDPSEQQMMELAGMDDVGSEYAPFFLAIDECHSVLTDGDEIETMLMEARSKKLGLMLSTQVLRSLPDDAADAIISNCNTILSLTPNHPEEAREIANRFGGMDTEDLQRTPDYHAQTQLNSEDDPFLAKLIPPYPPRHTIEEAYELIVTSLENYGSPVQSGEEILDEMHFDAGGAISAGEAESDASDGSEEQVDVTSDPAEQALYEAAYTVQIKQDAIGEFVASKAVKDEWRRRAGELGFTSEVSNVIEQAPDEYLQRQRQDGKSVMRVTPEGLEYAGLVQDTGSSASGGGDEHRWVLTEAYRAFTKLGMFVELPTQEGEEDPDGIADLPIDPMAAENIREVHAREERLVEEYPYLAELTDGLNISIEAETSTIKKPMQTLTNLRKAIDEHKLCVFACKDGSANHDEFGYWARRGEQIVYDVSGRGSSRTIDYDQLTFAAQGNRTFYNKVSTLSVASDTYALRPQSDADLVWREEGNEVVMSDEDGTEHARFESPEAAATPAKSNVPAYSIYDAAEQEYTVRAGGEKLVYGSREELEEDWMVVRAPFIPENEFDRMPTSEDFLFVVFPDEDTEAFDEPMIYERGEVRPLLPSDSSWSTSEARTEESTLTDEEPQPSSDDSAEQNSDEPEDDEASTGDTDHSGSIANAVSRLTGRD